MYRIKLTQGDRVRYLDLHGSLVIKSLASPFTEAEARDTADSIRNRGNYRGYIVEIEPIPDDEASHA